MKQITFAKPGIKTRPKRNGNDKIFDNSYNRGDVSYEIFGAIEVDKSYAKARLDSYNNSQDYYRLHLLYDIVETIYHNTEWYNMFGNVKKIPKQELCELYAHIFSHIEDDTFTNIEKFASIADFLDINYKILYEMMPHAYKVDIIQELDEKYNVIQKHKIVKLF
jgi:hypothetical protein